MTKLEAKDYIWNNFKQLKEKDQLGDAFVWYFSFGKSEAKNLDFGNIDYSENNEMSNSYELRQ